jgi:surface antigen
VHVNVAMVQTELLNLVGASWSLSPRSRRLLRRFALVLLLTLPCIALAAPPDWAPAHGRRKHDASYEGYSGRQWNDDYGVRAGSCNRTELGAVLGAAAGGAVGSQVAKGDDRAAAIVVGAVIGAAIGSEIGHRMDRTDRACVGQSLELASVGESVSWTNPDTQVTYQFTPLAEERREDACRKFRLIAHGSFGLSEGRTVACPGSQGVWSLAPELQLRR